MGLKATRPTGVLTLGSLTSDCITGWACYNATIASPDVIENISSTGAILAIRRTNQSPVNGMIFAIGGHAGSGWWDHGTPLARAWEDRMIAAGYDIVQYRHLGYGWPDALLYRQGFLRLGCRPATAIRWVHDNWFRGGRYMVMGSSEGSAAIGYAMAMYGIDSIVRRIAYISGPPMTDLVDACLAVNGDQLAHPSESGLCDEPDGFQVMVNGYGPCTLRIASPFDINWWQKNSVETADDRFIGGQTIGNYVYPNTRVGFIIGDHDSGSIHFHAQKLIDKFGQVGQPITVLNVPTMGHIITTSQDGLNTLFDFLISSP